MHQAPILPATLSLAELLGAFSYALDITEGQPEGHCVRACWIGTHVGQEIGLAGEALRDLYYTVLLKDLGCSSNAARICQLYLADDLSFKRDFKFVGNGIKDALAFVFSHTGRGAPLRMRTGAILNILRNGPEIARDLIATRCDRGANIARRLRFSEAVAEGIYALDEHWDGSGKPDGLVGEAIPLFARIALLAQVADVFHHNAGRDAAIAEVTRRSGTWFDPALVRAFLSVARNEEFWRALASPLLEARLLELEPAQQAVPVDEDYLDAIAAAFGEVVDAKSPYTGGHSVRVADYADAIAERIGIDAGRRRWLRRGALLHDIGKLGVSNMILDKPGRLDESEWAMMRDHAVHTQAILGRVAAFRDLAPIAAAHHERLDGTGYPKRLTDAEIAPETRIITVCDFYDALTADRPYRAAMPVEQALAIIGDSVGAAVDRDCFEALKAHALR
ncbi:HD-GYP domain-containing protein [Allosphingosinicella flava]|uniref:HD-GYP domain-containing protein n=1 Tax=Allosphingosinicella flava TaxID=2771430 RepID=A0A7T2GJ57_9SPHN|nr:HD-GYP domain-containing protein [Sphingosinicella flava]QPQ54801.1 HD-GYP domain-containing protein [Sphingosinicella flava]